MNLPERGMLTGFLLAGLLGVAAVAPPALVVGAIADEPAARAFDPAQIVKFEGRDYQVDNEDWVSTNPTSTSRIKKVEAGKVSYVTVTTTATGTYSTDAMFSRNVQYPGVTVTDVTQEPANSFHYWINGKWSGFHARIGNSFSYYQVNRR